MLNIENKYKAFHISFHPHTSLTAGLNIFEKTFHSRRKRGCIYTSTHANERVYGLETRSPNHYSIKTIQKEEEIKVETLAPTQIYQSTCARSIVWAGSYKVGFWSQFLRKEYHTLHDQRPPLWRQTGGPLENPSFCYRWVAFGVNKKGILN